VLPRYHAAARHGNLVADLVTLVRSACEHLLAPPAAHSRLRIYDALYLQVSPPSLPSALVAIDTWCV
jgi:hypothetical protein